MVERSPGGSVFRPGLLPGLVLSAGVATTVLPSPAWAQQIPDSAVIIHGRAEDALSREPLAGALVVSGDSAWATIADSLGNFALPLAPTPPFVLSVEQFGYEPTIFELDQEAPSRVSVFLLEPAPLALEGITVVEESALERLTEYLERRRNGFSGSVRAFDRERLAGMAADNAFDLVRRAVPFLRNCWAVLEADGWPGNLCRRTRGRSFGSPGWAPLLVCVDGVESLSHEGDLYGIPIEEVALAEFYGRGGNSTGQVRIYTRQWMLSSAARSTAVFPADFGC